MTSTDIRNENFHHLRSQLVEKCATVLRELAVHGPCTTRQLAQLSGRDILSVRPRITDLKDLGLVVLSGREGGEGIYAVASQSEWEQWHATVTEERTTGQLQMI